MSKTDKPPKIELAFTGEVDGYGYVYAFRTDATYSHDDILTACNAHDALVKVVGQYLELFGVYSDPKADKLHARARDVLALAKGEQQ